METWFNEAKRVSTLEAETCFLLQEDFYYGPDTHPEVSERKLVEALEPPAMTRHVPSMVRTTEALGNEAELARYYLDVIPLGRKYGKRFGHICHYFWVRFWLWNTEEDVQIAFPWYDTLSEVDGFVRAVTEGKDGQIFWDADQCWELEVHSLEGDFFARLRDPDDDKTHVIVCFPAAALLEQLARMQERSRSVVKALSSAIGRDVWTARDEWPSFLEDGKS